MAFSMKRSSARNEGKGGKRSADVKRKERDAQAEDEQKRMKLAQEAADVFGGISVWVSKIMEDKSDDFISEKYAERIQGPWLETDIRTEFLRRNWKVLFTGAELGPGCSEKLRNCTALVDSVENAFIELHDAYEKLDTRQRMLVAALKAPE